MKSSGIITAFPVSSAQKAAMPKKAVMSSVEPARYCQSAGGSAKPPTAARSSESRKIITLTASSGSSPAAAQEANIAPRLTGSAA